MRIPCEALVLFHDVEFSLRLVKGEDRKGVLGKGESSTAG